MKSSARSRVFLLVVGVLALLLVWGVGRRLQSSPPPERPLFHHTGQSTIPIGEFKVPPLPGWLQSVIGFQDDPYLILEKREKEGELEINLTEIKNTQSGVPKNSSELQSDVQRLLAQRTTLDRSIGRTSQFGPSRPTTLNGMTAVETPATIVDKLGDTETRKYFYFIHNGRYYLLDSGIHISKGNPFYPPLQSELDQALVTVDEYLVPQPASISSGQPTATAIH